jgi:putative transposase
MMWIGRTSSRRWPRPVRRRVFQVHAYCLMGNHFHLVVETPEANLVAGMRWLLSTYTIRLNHRHKLVGHVFSGRYKALLVEGRDWGGHGCGAGGV